jgi:hypothetical protein
VNERGIVSVLKGRQIRSGGFAWAYGTKRRVDTQAIRKANIERRNRMVGRKVTQYDLKGKKIAAYYTIAEAGRKTKISTSDIHAVLKGKQRSAGGYIWRKGFGKLAINVKGYLTGNLWRASKQEKKVAKYNLKGKPVKIYESIKKAAGQEGISASFLSMAVTKKIIVRGFLWNPA